MVNQTQINKLYWFEIYLDSPFCGKIITTRIPVVCTKPNDGINEGFSICWFIDIDLCAVVTKPIPNEKLFDAPTPNEIEEKEFLSELRELYVRNQIRKNGMKKLLVANSKLKSDLRAMFYGIGQPLNDNVLGFDKKQMLWCARVMEKIEQINSK